VFVMMRRTAVFAGILSLVAVLGVYAQNGLKSGPQVGEKVPGPFHPLNINGEAAGKKNCLYCSNGGNPVAVVFARELTPGVSKLIKQLDAATLKNGGKSMGSYAVFMTDSDQMQNKLEGLVKEAGLKKFIVSIDNPAGPKEYHISKDAAVTVLLYNEFVVAANHAFSRGDLSDSDVTRIVADVAKIVR
jgi:hypothetical protein